MNQPMEAGRPDAALVGTLTAAQRAERHVHPQAKLTAGQVETIRRRYSAGGVLQRELADEYGLSQSHVSEIVHGRYWAPDPPADSGNWFEAEHMEPATPPAGHGGAR